jgi:hypothetical protein
VEAHTTWEHRIGVGVGPVQPDAQRTEHPPQDPFEVRGVLEARGDALQHPSPLDVDLVRAVDHHVRDGRIAQQRLEWAEATELVDEVAHRAGPDVGCSDHPLRRERPRDGSAERSPIGATSDDLGVLAQATGDGIP